MELKFVPLVMLISLSSGTSRTTVEDFKETCIDSKYHKTKPGPESSLFKQCSPWKNRSCCTAQVSQRMLESKAWMNFNLNHCAQLSPKCQQHFDQDACFCQCSPNTGPWIQPIDKVLFSEQFVNVPLCESDCNRWYDACKDDLTCLDNWYFGFNWTHHQNHCPTGSVCKKFSEMYGTAKNFCQTVWNHSWKVVPDNKPCMTVWFDGSKGNPNDALALRQAKIKAALIG